MTRRLFSLLSAAVLGLALAVTTSQAPAGASVPTIVIKNFGYTGDLTVTPRARVRVINKDAFVHTLTDKKTHHFNTGDIPANGGKRSFVAPTKPGKYPFGCKHHPEMAGTLVVARPAHPSTLAAPRSRTIHSGDTVHLETELSDATNEQAIAHAEVILYGRAGSSGSFRKVAVANTDAGGRAEVVARPASTRQYRWRFAGTARHQPATSAIGTVRVH